MRLVLVLRDRRWTGLRRQLLLMMNEVRLLCLWYRLLWLLIVLRI